MEPVPVSPAAISAATVDVESAAPPKDRHLKARAILKRGSLWLIALLILAGVGAFAYHREVLKDKVHYTTAPVTRGDIQTTVVAAGLIQPVSYVDVGAQTSGKLQLLKVKQGDYVKKNQLLAEIDPVLADTALTSANAGLANMTAQRTSQKDTLVLDKMQNKRNERLFKQGFVSASSVDITQSALDVARSNTHALSDQMKVATATVNTAKANVGYTKITAPMAGEVVSITTLQGQTVNANQAAPIILRIGDMSTVTVWAQVSEADIVHVKPGQDVYFTILGDTRKWNGKIRQILPTPELINNVVFYDVLFDIPNPNRELEIQMTAQVFIVLAQAKNVLLVPLAALSNTTTDGKTTVQVLKADGTVEQRAVTIGIKSEISAEVTQGLTEKELVVIGTATAQKTSSKSSSKSPLSGKRGP